MPAGEADGGYDNNVIIRGYGVALDWSFRPTLIVNGEETKVPSFDDIFLLFEGGGDSFNVSNVVGSVVS